MHLLSFDTIIVLSLSLISRSLLLLSPAQLPEHFRPAPRETEADLSGNIHSMHRKLKDRVYFMVQQEEEGANKKDENISWTFPTVELKDMEEESLLEAAQRSISILTKRV